MNKLSVIIALLVMWFSFSSSKEKGYYASNRCEDGIYLSDEALAMKVIQQRFDEESATFNGTDFGDISVKFRVDSLHRLYSVRFNTSSYIQPSIVWYWRR